MVFDVGDPILGIWCPICASIPQNWRKLAPIYCMLDIGRIFAEFVCQQLEATPQAWDYWIIFSHSDVIHLQWFGWLIFSCRPILKASQNCKQFIFRTSRSNKNCSRRHRIAWKASAVLKVSNTVGDSVVCRRLCLPLAASSISLL